MNNNFLSLVLAAIAGGSIALGGNHWINSSKNYAAKFTQKEGSNTIAKLTNYNGANREVTINPDFVKSAEKTMPIVVFISTSSYEETPESYFWGLPPQKREGSGSGVIISGDGYIVTNNHVVAGAEEVFVSLYDNRKYKAQVIGNDPKTDLAVIKIKEDNLPVAELGNSDDVKIGEWVLAVGNPFNLNSTVTAGIISAKGRSINAYENGGIESFIQTDAAVNPGNSGGALVNTEGKLIGINAAIASPTGSYTGYSFAIPVNLAKKVVNDLIQYGQVKRGMLGVSIQEVDSRLVSQKKLNVTKGVYVAKVQENGDAYKAGVKEGDVIVKINGMNITSIQELREQVASHNLGDVLKVTVNRNGREKDINVKVKSL